MGVDYYLKGAVTSNTIVFWLVYIGSALFVIFALISLLFFLQDPYCAVGPNTVKECWVISFENLKAQFSRLFAGF